MFFNDWLSQWRGPKPAQAEREACDSETTWRGTAHLLAGDVQQLCRLCEDLLHLIDRGDTATQADMLLRCAPRQIERIRASARQIMTEAGTPEGHFRPAAEDPYSLAALRQLMAEER